MKKILSISILTAALGAASCDSYLDINQDPNSPTEENITSDMLMPSAEMNVASSYGDYLRITGGYFSQIYCQLFGTSNYLDYSEFQMSAARSSSCYTQLMVRAGNNLQSIREMATEDEDWGTYLAATVLRDFSFQVLVDCYGEIPYTEAFDESNLSPAYDDGLTVYEGILAELDEALANVTTSTTVCTNFLFSGETADPWIKFANALKLRILMRMYNQGVEDEVAALIAEDNFPTEDVAYSDCWTDETGARNPFYDEDFGPDASQSNLGLNQALLGAMQYTLSDGSTYTDPRLEAFFEPNDDGEYFGGISGTNMSTSSTYTLGSFCRPVATATMPLHMLTLAEIEFFKAEYYARTGNSTQAQAHYEAAVEASFNTAGVDGADEYIALNPYDQSNYLECIGVAKWIAMSGTTPFEGYCDLRRLGYPAFNTSISGTDLYDSNTDTYDVSSYVPGTLYTPISVFNQVGSNQLLMRWPYPQSSSASNSNVPTFPGYTTPIFWAE